MIKALGLAIMARKEELYALNYQTGAEFFFSFSSERRPTRRPARRAVEERHLRRPAHLHPRSRGGRSAVNAFNFPVWGMLEKLAPTMPAGVPACEPAPPRRTCSTGVIQLIVGGVGDLFDHLTGQDIVSFTGSAHTALKLKSNPTVVRKSVRFVAEQDSLNASLLGPEAAPGTPEFDLFIKEVATEMTVKAGQKCTAIRPRDGARAARMRRRSPSGSAKTKVGDPRAEDTRMGALVDASASATTSARASAS